MFTHLRACIVLLVLTLIICCVFYPLTLWAAGWTLFPAQAEGSLVRGPDGQPIGSRLIAQAFAGDEYFQPRPSAASYNASASGASNFAASNYLLRDRIARTLGPIVRYRDNSPSGRTVQDDIAAWVATQPDIVTRWATEHPGVAQAWVNTDDKHKDAVTEWSKSHPDAAAEWKKANPEGGEPKPADLAVAFFTANSAEFQKSWLKLIDDATWSVPAVFFDMWRQAHPDARLEDVPADLVMASGSGLDPHITLAGARYQLDRVVAAWAAKKKMEQADVRRIVELVLREWENAPLEGWVGVPLVNVLEVNAELKAWMESPVPGVSR
jgi:K+-transporting ATPase ATPase C chain